MIRIYVHKNIRAEEFVVFLFSSFFTSFVSFVDLVMVVCGTM